MYLQFNKVDELPAAVDYDQALVGQPSHHYYELVREALGFLEEADAEDSKYDGDMCAEVYRQAVLHGAIAQLRALAYLCCVPR